MRLIGIEHLHFIILSTRWRTPHLFAGRTFFANVLHGLFLVIILNGIHITSIPSAQIRIDKSSRLLQKSAGSMGPITRIILIVYFFCDNSDFC